MIRTYAELSQFVSFEERFNYLKLPGVVGESTFGFDRYLNQLLYHSPKWKRVREKVLLRDDGCDLGIYDRQIFKSPIIHHLNPITHRNIENQDSCIYDLNNLITTSYETHQAIHFQDESKLVKLPIIRQKGDTNLW